MRYLLLPFLVVFTPVIFPAQDTPAPVPQPGGEKKMCKLAGRAVNELTGEPVRKAALTLYGAGRESRNLTATSDAAGHFSFDNVEPGTYHFTAQKPGFLEKVGKPVTLAPGQEIADFEFKLTPQGVIAGKVVDEDGEPIAGRASVTAFRQVVRGTARHVTFIEQETTNDLGEFRVANLSPGSYIVAASLNEFRMTETTAKKEPEEALVQTFYPGVTETTAATVIELKAGQELTGINIPLKKSRVYRIEGKIAGLTPAHSPRNMTVSLIPRERSQAYTGFGGGFGTVKPDGTFEVVRVQPGAYHLTLMLRGDGRPQTLGRTPVDVSNGNVTGVIVAIVEPLQVAGTVRAEGDQKIAYDALHVIMRPAEGLPFFGRPVTVNTDGTFKIDGVPPDKYDMNVYGIPENTYMKSVRLGKQEALDSGLDLTEAQGTAAIEIVLGDKPGTVEGTVQQDGKPAPGIGVTMVPETARAGQRDRWKFASTDQNGRFTIKGVAPGEYKLYALQQASEFDVVSDPDSLKPFEHKAVKVKVEEGATARADLSPIKPEDASPQ
jgi:hypothetical protein